ncbi:hypothetical protein HMPREF3153_01040 [Corynebacterium sp. HMSC06C06]|uniref:hypothetical protein n=1 Tax=Corynebacterium sp. HMSC06C06 TaxID=1581121 RepID=UPI0008A56E03|nr:hypothetical protein [Corynebacterium sp. HMSC06C06]OFT54701.1 hypothetical protein HMPREF3153_01040 [Corynebacterium sp. HMSC06C06]HAT1244103.1 hypothetical protein [Corynebacterium striatum]
MPKKTWTTPIHALRTIVVDTDEENPAVEIYAVEGATLDELQARAYSPADVELTIKALTEANNCAQVHSDEHADVENWHEDNSI